MRIGVYLEESPHGAAGHAEGLPGCFAFGKSGEEVLALMPAAIAEFVDWLRKHEEVSPVNLPTGELPEVEVLETINGEQVPNAPGHSAALFSGDQGYSSDTALETHLRWLDHSRADLLNLVRDLVPDTLDHAHHLPGEEPSWTIRQILRHSANAEYGYVRRFAGPWLHERSGIDEETPADIFERLRQIREVFKWRLRATPLAERGRVIYPAWSNRPNRPWTFKMTLRRALEHEREHTQQISTLLYQIVQQQGPLVGG